MDAVPMKIHWQFAHQMDYSLGGLLSSLQNGPAHLFPFTFECQSLA